MEPKTGDIKDKLSLIRRYIFEVAIIALTFAVVTLHNRQTKYLSEDRAAMLQTIADNSRVIEESSEVVKENKELIKMVYDLVEKKLSLKK